jgi:predicted RNase H-like HicB family nuclease
MLSKIYSGVRQAQADSCRHALTRKAHFMANHRDCLANSGRDKSSCRSGKPCFRDAAFHSTTPFALMARQLNYTVTADDEGVFIARCIELDIETDGYSEEDAVANLREALDRFFEDPDAVLNQELKDQ